MSQDVSSLRADYLAGWRTPTQEVERFLTASSERRWGSAWIHRLDAAGLLQRARELEALARADSGSIERLPLYLSAAGVPRSPRVP